MISVKDCADHTELEMKGSTETLMNEFRKLAEFICDQNSHNSREVRAALLRVLFGVIVDKIEEDEIFEHIEVAKRLNKQSTDLAKKLQSGEVAQEDMVLECLKGCLKT